MSEAADGTGVHRLPGGVYGFTYSPGLRDTPVFRKTGSRAFEVHKAPSGEVFLVGFLAAPLADGACEVELHPAADPNATALAAVPMSRVDHVYGHSTRETGNLRLRLRAV
ncbi:MAG: hypothetical protein ACRD96_15560 [Bryobacteraceae bacterium]